MTFLLNPYLFSVAFTAWYATANGGNTDISDVGAIQSGGTFTIPSAWNGRKVRVGGCYYNEAGANVTIEVTGSANPDGLPKGIVATTAAEEAISVHSAPIVVATGDTFTGLSLTNANGNAKYIELMPSGIKSGLFNRITSSFSVGAAFTAVQWNNEVYDTEGYHDNTTNPSRITIQSGTTGLIRLSCSIEVAASGGEMGLAFYKNGSIISSTEADSSGAANNLSIITGPITCTAGDYFEVYVRTTSATSVSVSKNSWFAIEELPSSLNYVTGTVSGSLSSGSYVSSGTLTVPTGVTLVRAGFRAVKSSTTGAVSMHVEKASGHFVEGAGNSANNAGQEMVHAMTPPFSVSPGDVIHFMCYTNAGAQTISGTTWLEEVPVVTV